MWSDPEDEIPEDTRPRRRALERKPFPPSRRFVTGGLAVGRRMSPMHGLIEVDVTQASRNVADAGLSFTGFVVAAVGRAAALHPEVHAYQDWMGRLVLPTYVDVTALIEVPTDRGPFPLAHLIKDADVREVADISREIREVKKRPIGASEGRRLDRYATLGGRIPGLPRLFYTLMARSARLRRMSGTVTVSSLGMMGGGGGHAIGFPTIFSLTVLVGGRTRKPVARGDDISVADILDLTLTFDHRTVDGGPAARFVADLREILTNAEVLI